MKGCWGRVALILAVALGAGCGAGAAGADAAGGRGGATGAGGSCAGFVGCAATMGFVGSWFAFGDGVGPNANLAGTDAADSDCIKAGFTPDRCSQITAPTPGQPFAPDPENGMCTAGTAARMISGADGGAPNAVDLWGAGIGVDFNDAADAGRTRQTFDLTQYSGLSFDFSGTIVPAGKMRVLFPFMGEETGNNSLGDPPYWAANATNNDSTVLGNATPAHNVVQWSRVLGPAYLMNQTPPTTPPAFDPSKAYGIAFQVFTNATSSTPYAFCVNNLTLLQ